MAGIIREDGFRRFIRVIESKITKLEAQVVTAEKATTTEKVWANKADSSYTECSPKNIGLHLEVAKLQREKVELNTTRDKDVT